VIDERDLEQAERIFAPPERSFEGFIRRRDAKRRNRRIAAGVVGMAVFVAAIWIVTSVGPLERSETPVPGGDVTGPAETGPAVVDPLAGLTPTPYDPSLAERWSGDSSVTGAGAYSMPPLDYSLPPVASYSFHNPNSGMNIYWVALDPDAGPVSGGSSPLAVTLAGYDAIYQRIAPTDAGGSLDLWIIDLGDTKVRINLEAPQNVGANKLEKAYEIIASVQAPPRPDDLVSLTFWLPVGWDSK
jgi:hypothetical protein